MEDAMGPSRKPDSLLAEVEVVSRPDSILLKNGIALLDPDPIAKGAFGQVYVGKILNPVGLLAERVVWGEENPYWLGLKGIPYEDPQDDASRLPTPITDTATRTKVYAAAVRLWAEYLELRRQDPQRAGDEYKDWLNLIDPMLREDRTVAVKVLKPAGEREGDSDPPDVGDTVRRFIRENEILRRLTHPSIVRRFGLVRDPQMGWCLLLEFIEGETLEELLRSCEGRRMPLPIAAQLARELADAVAYIHGKGILHRDIKPQNIMVRHDTRTAVITDFGIGKWLGEAPAQQLTLAGMRMGTPRYMAPEQAKLDGTATRATDVYQLSTVLFEMVTGHHAYEEKDLASLFRGLTDPAARHPAYVRDYLPMISSEMEALIEIGRDKDPGQRWTIEEFRRKLDQVLSSGRFERRGRLASASDLTQSLLEVRMRKKEVAWEEHILETRLHDARLEARVEEGWRLLKTGDYREAHERVEDLAREVAALPRRYETLRLRVDELRGAVTLAVSRQQAEQFLTQAERDFAEERYPEVGVVLDAAGRRLEALPPDTYVSIHEWYRRLNERFEAHHRGFVELFNALRKSFVEKIRGKYHELHELYGSRKTIERAKVEDLLGQVASAESNLRTIDRGKIGPPAYDGTERELREQRVALEDLLARLGPPPA